MTRRTQLYGSIEYPTLADTGPMVVESSMDIGERLERFRIDDVLGRGGMGEVLSAHDDQLDRSVAIKRLRVSNPPPEVLARFLREARIQGRLEHPAVVPVHELHTEGEQPFFVMKQLAGATLAELLRGEFVRQRMLRAFVDVCLAIEFAHTRGVVHRDLKPANIVLGDFGEVYVLDWGVAWERDVALDEPTTAAGTIVGTPGYISPEQLVHSEDLDGRADVYSLGCILFELLALEPLHAPGALTSALVNADARPSVRVPDREIPPELDAICARACAFDREQRFPTARALGEAVQAFLDGNRDSALRGSLALKELAAATTELARNTTDGRRNAMRAASRALALDPKNPNAADLVGHLMLEPPAQMPPEVERELDDVELEVVRASARFGTFAALSYLAFFPVMYWVGFRELWYLIVGPAISAAIILTNTVLARRWLFWPRYVAIGLNLSMFALFGIVVNPVVFGPGPPIIMITLLATQRRLLPPWLAAALTSAAVLSPWLLGATISVAGSDLIVHTRGHLDLTTTLIGLVVYTVALAQLAAFLGRSQDDDRRRVRRTLQIQTWQLRQLVPRPMTM